MSDNKLFRKEALEKLSSPEQLDLLMQVTSPKGWLALWTVGAILVGVVAWSILGSIPTRVDGDGILIRGGSLRELKATGDGVLSTLSVAVNGSVEEGQAIGEIALPAMDERIKTAESRVVALQDEASMGRAEDEATIAGHRGNIRRVRGELETISQELQIKQASFEKGLITKDRLLSLEREQSSLQARTTELRAQIRAVEQRIRSRDAKVTSAEREVQELQSTGDDTSQVRSPAAGRIVELKRVAGDRVRNGEVLAIIEPASSEMLPVVYVSSIQGKSIHPGMEAQISPSTVKREEFGFMKGIVKSVGDYPVTPDAVASVVANSALVQELLGQASKIEVRADLLPMSETPSGFEWSSSMGPPFKIASGTRVTVSVVVDRRAPITYILPIIRSTLGLS